VLSPVLFNLYINDLFNNQINNKILAFADDIYNTSLKQQKKLLDSLKMIEEWRSQENHLKIRKQKSAMI
jgi:hypothetical protein